VPRLPPVRAVGRGGRRRPAPPRAGGGPGGAPPPPPAARRPPRAAGAMLDVYEHYRLEPGHALLSLENVVLTPHLAGMTQESRARMGVAAADDMLRMLSGEPPRNLVTAVHR
jgi:hypothetical protein